MKVPSLFSNLKPGEPQPWKAVYHGVEYPGEVLIAETWQPELGEIARDINFRIVVLTSHQRVPYIADRRIAVCVPGRERPRLRRAAQEYLALREERETYGIGRERRSLLKEKAEEVLREEASLYAAGMVFTRERLLIDATELFSIPDNESRFQLLSSALLSRAYPRLPINVSALNKTLRPSDIGKVFDGFFGKGDSREARSVLRSFAPALGLARPEDPYRFDPRDCRVFPIIARRLEQQGGSLPILSLYHGLCSSHGLTWSLVTLYLLCFVYHRRPQVELRLKPGHALILRSGKMPPQDALTAELIPQIWWTSDLERVFDRLCYSEETPWNALLPYARHLCPELEPVANLKEVKGQEQLLLGRLGELKETMSQVEGHLDALSPKLGKLPKGILQALERLSRIAQSRDHFHFYALVQQECSSSQALGEDISRCQALSQLSQIGDEILAIKSYLDGVVLREGERELDMDRVSILQQLRLEDLLPNLHLFPSVKALFDWFLSRYRALYLAHHQDYHQEVASLRLVLEDSKPEVDALRRLNSIAELGEPVGEELFVTYEQLLAKASPCPIGEVSVDQEPTCPHCQLVLTARPPKGEVERFLHRLKQALKQQQRRLSSEAIRHILAQSGERRVDQFIKVVQSSELSPLVNVLDDELVDFLRQLLQEAHIEIEWRPTLSELAEKFPSLEEGEVDAAAAEFARALKKAFAKAKKEHPGKRVRLSFKE